MRVCRGQALSWVGQHLPGTPVLRRLRQEDPKSKARAGNLLRVCLKIIKSAGAEDMVQGEPRVQSQHYRNQTNNTQILLFLAHRETELADY